MIQSKSLHAFVNFCSSRYNGGNWSDKTRSPTFNSERKCNSSITVRPIVGPSRCNINHSCRRPNIVTPSIHLPHRILDTHHGLVHIIIMRRKIGGISPGGHPLASVRVDVYEGCNCTGIQVGLEVGTLRIGFGCGEWSWTTIGIGAGIGGGTAAAECVGVVTVEVGADAGGARVGCTVFCARVYQTVYNRSHRHSK